MKAEIVKQMEQNPVRIEIEKDRYHIHCHCIDENMTDSRNCDFARKICDKNGILQNPFPNKIDDTVCLWKQINRGLIDD